MTDVLAIGGGHGLAATLSAAKCYASSITALVSLADDGGSSGELRSSLGIPPPGDLRKCLLALANENLGLANAMEFRFENNHALGNLILVGLTSTMGGIVPALDELARVFHISGRILPATDGMVTLVGSSITVGENNTVLEGLVVKGQSQINKTEGITNVRLEQNQVTVPQVSIDAIQDADQILIGPGSLYTSVLAALCPTSIRQALARAKGKKIYICNLKEQVPETKGYTVRDHLVALERHEIYVDFVLIDSSNIEIGGEISVPYENAVLSQDGRVHDSKLLARCLEEIS